MSDHRHADAWNHNVHYHRLVLAAVPDGASRALDAGCGEGVLARDLRDAVPQVVAMDRHGPTLGSTARTCIEGVEPVLGDIESAPFAPASFDFVACVATLHHMDAEEGLRCLRDLVRPGGALVVVGLARSRYPQDAPCDLAATVATRLHRLTKTHREVSAPTVWPPPLTYGEVRAVAERVLPGVRYRRHLLWRYSLTWVRPREAGAERSMRQCPP